MPSTSLNGIDYGLGFETLLVKNISLRGEFKHSDYRGNMIVNTGANFAPSDNMATLGIIYHL